MVACHHRLNGHEFEQAPGGGEGQGNLACCSPWSHRELDMSLSKLLEVVKDREAWHAVVHGVTESWT